MGNKLDNYLLTHRKRTGLTQRELAFLLGCRSGANVSRHERLARTPSLETVLAYEAAFGVAARELFAGTYDRVERQTLHRARQLAAQLATKRRDRTTVQKLAWLEARLGQDASRPPEIL